MATTISTSSKSYFNKIQKYLSNKKLFFCSSINNGVYALIIFNLDEVETHYLVQKMTRHLHLTSKQLEPMALAA